MLWQARYGFILSRAALDGGGAAASIAWDPATVANVTLSNSNLTATNTGTTSTDQGAHAPSTAGKSSGKYYFEITYTTLKTGVNIGFGVGTTASSYTNMGNSATAGAICYTSSGAIWHNGSSASRSISGRVAADVIGVAVDLDNLNVWFKVVSGTPGNWNGNASGDPATNSIGVSIPSGTHVPFCIFGGTNGQSGAAFTANFGASAFTGSAPSGFTSGWPS